MAEKLRAARAEAETLHARLAEAERRLAEAMARPAATAPAGQADSEARLKLFIERAPAAIAMFDAGMRYLAVSRRFLTDHRLPLEPAAVVGRSHAALFPDCPESWREIHRRVLAGESHAAEADPFPHADGHMDLVRWEMTPWHRADGSVGGALLFTEIVTARVAADQALAESAARLRLALEAGELGTWSWEVGRATAPLEWDARCIALHGLPPGARVDYATWQSLLLPEDLPAAEARVARALDPADPDDDCLSEYRVALPDGRWRSLAATGRAFFEADKGTPAGRRAVRIIGTIRDVTAAREAEAARHAQARTEEALERLALIARRVRDPVLLLHRDGHVIEANAAAAAAYGHDRAALLRLHVRDLRASEAMAELQAQMAEADCSGVLFETLHRRADGSTFPVEVSSIGANLAGDRVLVSVIRDITERKRAEAALADSEARWRTLAEALPQLAWTCRPDGACDWLNRRWEDYTGVPAAQHLGEGWLEAVHPEDREHLLATWQQAIKGGATFDAEVRLRGADGTWRWFKNRAVPLRAPDGAMTQWFGTSTDIADMVAAREVLAREAEQLDRLAEERGRALAESEAKLAHVSKMEALGRLAGGIAHDFNNVLQAVQGGLALASKHLRGAPEPARRYIGLAAGAAARGAAVTGRLLAFSRRGELHAEPVAPEALLTGLAEFLRPAMGPKIALRVQTPPGLPALLADRGQLEAVLVNLVNNARDAMPDGGGLTLSAEAVAVPGAVPLPHGLAPGAYLRLSVVDAGEGMPPEVLARVTEPFFTTKPKGKGTGLGLAMARGFAEQSGGGLLIESRRGHGTTVSVWLPRVPDRKGALPRPQDGVVPVVLSSPSGATTVLLAEDQAEVRAVLAAQLEDQGYRVLEAADAATALALLDDGQRADALVTDLAMPGALDGLDLLREARARLPRLPAVLLTGHMGDAAPEKMKDAERGGPFALLRKPATREVLLDRLGRVLRWAGATDQ